jgi:rhodanese-related sulfurtransferase
VRDPEEFARRRLAGSVNAPGGQLVQATDTWIGVRNARIALLDDDGVRARMSAAWLRQMGHRDVFVVEGGLDAAAIPARPPVVELAARVPTMTAAELAPAEGVLVIDLARSVDFRDGHIPGAVWAIRSRLLALKRSLGRASAVILTSPDGALAKLAVPEVRTLTEAPVHVLEGGTAAWVAEGYRLDRNRANPPDEACADVYLRPYDRNAGVQEAMRAYLAWEIDLVHEITRDGTVHFGV